LTIIIIIIINILKSECPYPACTSWFYSRWSCWNFSQSRN